MNRSELIKILTDETGISLENSTAVVEIFFNSIKESLLEGERVEIRGFGSFKMKEYAGYAGRNPKSGQSVEVAPKRLPFFRAGKDLKDFINS